MFFLSVETGALCSRERGSVGQASADSYGDCGVPFYSIFSWIRLDSADGGSVFSFLSGDEASGESLASDGNASFLLYRIVSPEQTKLGGQPFPYKAESRLVLSYVILQFFAPQPWQSHTSHQSGIGDRAKPFYGWVLTRNLNEKFRIVIKKIWAGQNLSKKPPFLLSFVHLSYSHAFLRQSTTNKRSRLVLHYSYKKEGLAFSFFLEGGKSQIFEKKNSNQKCLNWINSLIFHNSSGYAFSS